MTSRKNTSAKPGRRRILVVLITAAMTSAFVAVALGASAPWGNGAGGDSGQSGYQAVAEGALPIGFVFRHAPESGALRTQPMIGAEGTTGAAATDGQALAYGRYFTSSSVNNRNDFYIRRLDTGALRGSVTDLDSVGADADADGFGPVPGKLYPITSATAAGGPGVIFQLHNDDDSPAKTAQPCIAQPDASTDSGNDIALAWFDEKTGEKKGDASIGLADGCPPPLNNTPVSDGYTIESSGVLGPPATDGSGARGLIFTGKHATAAPRLYRVNVSNAGTPGSVSPATDSPAVKDVAGLNTTVTPAIAYLEDPNSAPGVERSYALAAIDAGAGGSDVRAFTNTGALADGPAVPTDVPGSPKAIAVPVNEDGLLPGQGESGAAKAPSIYVAYENAGKTVVRRFVQNSNSLTLTQVAESPELPGAPGPGLAITSEVIGGVQEEGSVVVANGANVYVLDSDTLSETARLQDGAPDEPDLAGSAGFTKSAPTASGSLIYLTRDDGTQLVLRLSDAEFVPSDATGFQEREENLDATLTTGRPAVSNGYIAWGSDLGIWVYRAALNPQVDITQPLPGAQVDDVTQFVAQVTDPDGAVTEVTFKIDGGNAFHTTQEPDVPDGDVYSTAFDTFDVLDGAHVLTVTGKDDANTLGSDSATFVVNNFEDPSASLKVNPSAAQPTGTLIELDASGSAPTPDEDEEIIGYRFDLDGNGTFEKDNGGEPKLATSFSTPGQHDVSVQVEDSNGDTAAASATVVAANRPPVPAFSAPALIKPGQSATFDASASKDPDGSITLYEWDLDGNGDFETNTGTTPTVTKQFPNAGTFRIQLRVLDDSNAPASIAKDLVVGNINPLAAFVAVPTAANTNERIVFDASTSRDFDGSITRYQWDLDGNGSFEVDGGNNPRTSRVYTTAGVVNVRLRVTDSDGAAAEVVRQITIITAPIVRRTPRRLTLSLTPKSDKRAPYRYRARGTLTLPSGITKALGCSGTVTVSTKAGNRTISSRRAKLNKSCRYSVRVSFKNAKRFGKAKALRVQATYGGNARLLRKRSAGASFRVK